MVKQVKIIANVWRFLAVDWGSPSHQWACLTDGHKKNITSLHSSLPDSLLSSLGVPHVLGGLWREQHKLELSAINIRAFHKHHAQYVLIQGDSDKQHAQMFLSWTPVLLVCCSCWSCCLEVSTCSDLIIYSISQKWVHPGQIIQWVLWTRAQGPMCTLGTQEKEDLYGGVGQIPAAVCANLVKNYRKRLTSVIINKGFCTKY